LYSIRQALRREEKRREEKRREEKSIIVRLKYIKMTVISIVVSRFGGGLSKEGQARLVDAELNLVLQRLGVAAT
jgi:hypothetical protein